MFLHTQWRLRRLQKRTFCTPKQLLQSFKFKKEVSIGMENSKGFEIAVDPVGRILRVRAWGFWDATFIKKYAYALTEKTEELSANGGEWAALVNVTAFCPHSANIQRMMCQQIMSAGKMGLKKLAYVVKGTITQLQLNNIFLTSPIQRRFFLESEQDAMQWLLNENGDNQGRAASYAQAPGKVCALKIEEEIL